MMKICVWPDGNWCNVVDIKEGTSMDGCRIRNVELCFICDKPILDDDFEIAIFTGIPAYAHDKCILPSLKDKIKQHKLDKGVKK